MSSTTDGEATTTTAEPGASTTVPGDDADVLTAEEATAQLQSLLNNYRATVVGIRTRGAVDEAAQRDLSGVYSGQRIETELGFFQSVGPAGMNPQPPAVGVSKVQVTEATATCASGTADLAGVSQLFTVPLDVKQPYYYRLVPAAEGAPSPGWRLDYLSFSRDGQPLEQARCS